ncbi:GyrI-like domain-containing protein [Fusobacterium sp.]|uniref:GyrI-like domain-containing protein n=1 Tax=Fusobacterium sp. TaxID=68766 RepID=UPI00290421CE|nr:GyrI-like domain-containing protein [Fusobacterium sp.]MDU1910854.1 GyrI-like domain-containing protein [Fusobacterium sp.]
MEKVYVLSEKRLNNFKDSDIAEKIQKLWYETNLKIPQEKEISKYGIYSEYESNYKGDYTLFIGVDGAASYKEIIIEEENYQVFSVDTSSPYGIIMAWEKIWEMEEKGLLNRAYTVDYEKYYPDGKVEIFIALK